GGPRRDDEPIEARRVGGGAARDGGDQLLRQLRSGRDGDVLRVDRVGRIRVQEHLDLLLVRVRADAGAEAVPVRDDFLPGLGCRQVGDTGALGRRRRDDRLRGGIRGGRLRRLGGLGGGGRRGRRRGGWRGCPSASGEHDSEAGATDQAKKTTA